MIDIRQTVEYANYLKSLGWIVERIGGVNYFIKKFPLIGAILKIQRLERIRYKDIKILSKKHKVFQIIIEPKSEYQVSSIKSLGFRLSQSPYLPSKTLQIDLTQPISKITANFKKDAKYALKRGETITKKRYSSLSDLKKFHDAWRKSVNFTRFVPSLESLINLRSSFNTHKPIILTSHNVSNSITSGAIFTRSLNDYAYYWQGFTSNEGRTSLSQYSLVYQGILWAKKVGCKVFDFEGIYDERFPNKSWLGFTHFKRSFGGKEMLYPGCYTKLRFPYFDR